MNLIEPGQEGLLPLSGDITNKVVVLDWRRLIRRFHLPRYQLIKATGGFGCQEGSSGRVFGAHICDGESVTSRRVDLIGIATPDLISRAMADTRPVTDIDLSAREYLLVAKDGSEARGQTVEQARQRLKLITSAKPILCYEVHPESRMNELGFMSYPQGAPPTEVRIKKGKEWTASH